MMIKEVAEEVGSSPIHRQPRGRQQIRARASPGISGLPISFPEAVQGPAGGATSLIRPEASWSRKWLRKKKPMHPLTDEQITHRLRDVGYCVTRRTVAKYREDMRIRALTNVGSKHETVTSGE